MKTLTQATLTAGDRMLVVNPGNVSVFPSRNTLKSYAAWIVDEQLGATLIPKPWITWVVEFPAELAALINDVLNAEAPMQPLMDWVIEFGPANLAAEIEKLQANVLAAK